MENVIYEKDYGEEFRERSDKAKGQDFLDTFWIKDGLLRMTIFIGYFDEVY